MALIDYIWGASSIDLGREERKDEDKARDAKEDQEGQEGILRESVSSFQISNARLVAGKYSHAGEGFAHERTGAYSAVCKSTAVLGGRIWQPVLASVQCMMQRYERDQCNEYEYSHHRPPVRLPIRFLPSSDPSTARPQSSFRCRRRHGYDPAHALGLVLGLRPPS
jgi:hypothetical protein